MRCLILGANGLLGNAMIRVMSERQDWDVFGTVRSPDRKTFFPPQIAARLLTGYDLECDDDLRAVLEQSRPDVVVNCVSVAKEALRAADPLRVIPICALLPHRVASLCASFGARLVHFSTDGVFSGKRGFYSEDDFPDATDLYGRSKLLGEPAASHTLTIRTSMIGHELDGSQGVLGWFLAQGKSCTCYDRSIFSGLPTVALAQIVRDVVIPRAELSGVYHVASRPISKCDLLRLVAEIYGKEIELRSDESVVIDRSLNSERFHRATGYVPPEWPELIRIMHASRPSDARSLS